MWGDVRQVKLSREELYALVWSKPMTKVAAGIGISDVALAKTCKRLGIPTPPQGYWLRAGQRPMPKPLPKATGGQEDVVFSVTDKPEVAKYVPPESFSESSRVGDDLNKSVGLVKDAYRTLKSARVDKGLLVPSYGAAILDVRVSKEQLERGLLIFDAVIRATQELGGVWAIEGGATRFRAVGGGISVDLLERRRQAYVDDKYHPRRKSMELIPTGLLAFRVGGSETSSADMRDIEDSPLEGKIRGVAAKLFKECHDARVRKEERERREMEWREEREIKLKARRAAESERILRERLIEAAELHAKAAAIRAMCEGLMQGLEGREDGADVRSWVDWALAQADAIDPLRKYRGMPIEMNVDASLLRHVQLGYGE